MESLLKRCSGLEEVQKVGWASEDKSGEEKSNVRLSGDGTKEKNGRKKAKIK